MAAISLSATTVKSWFQYRCPRKTRYATLSGKERDAIPILHDVVVPAWARLGNRFEQHVVKRLAERVGVLPPAIGEDLLSQVLSVAFLKGERPEEYASQLLLEPHPPLRERLNLTPEVTIRRSYTDLVRLDRLGPVPVFQIIDVKATQHATPFHKVQVAFYNLLLQSTLEDLGAAGMTARTGQIWCLPAGSNGENGEYRVEEFRLEPYERLVVDFFANEIPVIAESVVTPGWDNTFFHIYFKCEQCEYLRHCSQTIAEEQEPAARDVSAIPGVSHEAKRTLHRLGVKTVGQLAEAHGLRASSGGSWALRRRAELLTRRARALVEQEVQRIPGVASYLMPPRADIALFLVVDVDPVENNLAALGYLRSGQGDTRHHVELLSGW